MKPTTTHTPAAQTCVTHKAALTPREGTLLMMVAQLLVLTCIVLATTLAELPWHWTLLLAAPPAIGGALLSRVWGRLPR
ncbi:hypothetical protein Ri1_25610 [Aeromonas dhakensis]|uniref:hypothetical protein n=1 Tax=Aeromonas dhakensis TaxID=196024 RepID=UPI00029A9928|nr:hypothetical protein [Aeromonas dhakensis]AHV35671.1 hypothetical protein AI20_10865 [Aeromonas hydrophila YL17]BEJ49962.1 hypothetical protein Ri1_25610 [Aeromonas dhakensis]HDZ8910941.1 hypothetical protein [Aeromonas dhakensis]